MGNSLLDAILLALRAEEQKVALDVGRGKVDRDVRDERIGIAKGLARAIDLVMTAAQAVNKEDSGG